MGTFCLIIATLNTFANKEFDQMFSKFFLLWNIFARSKYFSGLFPNIKKAKNRDVFLVEQTCEVRSLQKAVSRDALRRVTHTSEAHPSVVHVHLEW